MTTRVLVAGPPAAAVGGVASHTQLLAEGVRGCVAFDQRRPFIDRPTSRAGRVFMHAFALKRWALTIASRRPRVVHVQVTDTGALRDLAYVELAALLGTRIVSHVHATDFFADGSGRRDRALVHIAHRSDAVVVMSRRQQQQLARLRPTDPERIVYIGNPVPELIPAGDEPETDTRPFRVVCIGEICTRKGQAELVRAANALRDEGLDIEVELVGPWGDLDASDKRLIESSPGTILPGVLLGADKTRAYDRAGAFVLFSRSEGQPLAILEAMSRGLPVIATDTGGVGDMMEGARGNHLVDVGDTGGLRDALRALATDEPGRLETGASNRAHVQANHGIREHLLALVDVYRTVCSTT